MKLFDMTDMFFLGCILAFDVALFLYFEVKAHRLARLLRNYQADAQRKIIEGEKRVVQEHLQNIG